MTDRKWSAVIPVGRSTRDGRLLTALRLERSFPLPLMQLEDPKIGRGHLGARPVGLVLYADIEYRVLRVGGDVADTEAVNGRGWYAAIDLNDVTATPYHRLFGWRQRFTMTGSLIAVTLVPDPSWRLQPEVVFS